MHDDVRKGRGGLRPADPRDSLRPTAIPLGRTDEQMNGRSPIVHRAFGLLLLALVAGCTTPDGPTDVFDPYETRNRRIHEFNKGLDRNFVRPVARGYGRAVPEPVRTGVSNFGSNLDGPGQVTNDLLQANFADASHNAVRFVVNSTLGVAGIFDVATPLGLTARPTDFGETLHVWGTPEGAYLEGIATGPSTERDTAGRIVDFFTNPLSWVLPTDARIAGFGARVGGAVDDRYRYDSTVSDVLYNSADSYAQARSLYLQNRRFELNGGSNESDEFDIYEDLYEGFDE